MNWLFGYVKDKIGSSVCKLNFYVPVGESVLKQHDQKGLLEDGKRVTRYKKISYRYFDESEKFLKFRNGVYEIHPENEIYRDGKVRYYGVNAQTGESVGFHDSNGVVYSPEMLREQFDVSDIKAGRSILSGLGGDWLKYVIGLALGFMLGYIVTPYITQGLAGVGKLVLLFV